MDLTRPAARLALAAAAGALVTAAYFLGRGPATFDECILRHMTGVGDRAAAQEIYASCERTFGRPTR